MKHISRSITLGFALAGAATAGVQEQQVIPPQHVISPESSCSETQEGAFTQHGFEDCLAKQAMSIFYPEDEEYAPMIYPYNLRIPIYPKAVVVPEDAQGVSLAVRCGHQCGLKVQPRSGGHSFGNFGLGGKDGQLVISMQNFQDEIEIDEQGIAKVGTGYRLGNVALSIYEKGKRVLAHGTCPGVGVGGHFTHGGNGYSSRRYGLAVDQIVGLDVVTADGAIVYASEKQNRELYWALRGAADSFGIITTFYLQTSPAPENVVWYSIRANMDILKNETQFVHYFEHMQNFAQNATIVDRNLGMGMYYDNWNHHLYGTYFGSEEHFRENIWPSMRDAYLLEPQSIVIASVSWPESLQNLAEKVPLQQPKFGYDMASNFHSTALTIPSTNLVTRDAWVNYFNYIQTLPNIADDGVGWFGMLGLEGGPDSQVQRKDRDENFAAYHRKDKFWDFLHYSYVPDETTPQDFPLWSIEVADGLTAAIMDAMPSAEFGMYMNHVDPTLNKEEVIKYYYGGETLYTRLQKAKAVWDPEEVFWNPQSIAPAPRSRSGWSKLGLGNVFRTLQIAPSIVPEL
ncbi:FAD-binding domain-containing protein [Eremomyces bilateralis CBS 781.70]|uniref:FAD-binding domain-containing protein n=1 Tax=Eremomyces bilateralis CBS 781.70 TaxID=1392243 RepID=A0A6G1FXL2_9PEZI|nr:FAD-binding domain-containing protein [Eremomyces bilateralis CBS 781.70]KAF1810406.1 FAD-binding domain-containing protein [Eremomyces bilateralis CBS 781.70]